jgi:NADPH:quinone reductase-like Zn-dependent oxidoreductase
VAIGSNVSGFAIGDLVSVVPAFSFAEYGMYGEVVNAPVHAMAKNPPGVTHEEAAATWMMFVTAYGALINYGKLTSTDTVIIGAATSSVGLAAIQVGKMVGATTVALTRSNKKEEALRGLGADHVLLSDLPDLTDYIMGITDGKGARVVFDPVGGPNARSILRAMSHAGIYYQYGALDSRDIPVPVMEILTNTSSFRVMRCSRLLRTLRNWSRPKPSSLKACPPRRSVLSLTGCFDSKRSPRPIGTWKPAIRSARLS